jgi:hypothetical protein
MLTMLAWGAVMLIILAAGILVVGGLVDSLFDRE